ncbi:flagellar export protein FliJ [Azovibrio restrictus]|uniref:flagellar export protein FliJ n=1 Tax=Azovibrio restrictus TaxID=146938 RepID=UPI0026EF5285|nr:flagellar export protein FliJ [Azovibrio restrictus]
MNRKFPLQPLLELMRDRTDEATRRLGQLVAAEQSARSRLQLLQDYRREYLQKFQEAQTQGLTLLAWQNYQDFLAKIDEAIRTQMEQVELSARNTQQGQEHWQTQNRKLKAIDTLAIRHQGKLQQQENRQEQKLMDEFASRHHQTAPRDTE